MRRVTLVEVQQFGRLLFSRDGGLAVSGLLDGAYVSVVLRSRGLRPLLADQRSVCEEIDPSKGRRISEGVDAGLGVLPIAPTCLRRSIVALRAIQRRSSSAVLVIGVRKDGVSTRAHAWLEAEGEVINDHPDIATSYQIIATDRDLAMFPATASFD